MSQYTCFSNLLCHVCLQCSVTLCLSVLFDSGKQTSSGPSRETRPRSHQSEIGTELYEAGQLPWDIEMVVEEPLSDEEDGLPHSVSESESESESEKDCD
jgi:hypothetical protein